MFHNCKFNKRINRLHGRTLQLMYDDYYEALEKLFGLLKMVLSVVNNRATARILIDPFKLLLDFDNDIIIAVLLASFNKTKSLLGRCHKKYIRSFYLLLYGNPQFLSG